MSESIATEASGPVAPNDDPATSDLHLAEHPLPDVAAKASPRVDKSKFDFEYREALDEYRFPEKKKTIVWPGVAPPFAHSTIGNMYVMKVRSVPMDVETGRPLDYADVDSLPIYARKPGAVEFDDPTCVAGPCWPMVFVTATLITVPTIGITSLTFRRLVESSAAAAYVVLAITAIMYLITIVSYIMTACGNPGLLRRVVDVEEKDIGDEDGKTSKKKHRWIRDNDLRAFRRPRHRFEKLAGTMIDRTDHFCPWTGTMIAGRNMPQFKVFVSCVCYLLLVVFITFGAVFIAT